MEYTKSNGPTINKFDALMNIEAKVYDEVMEHRFDEPAAEATIGYHEVLDTPVEPEPVVEIRLDEMVGLYTPKDLKILAFHDPLLNTKPADFDFEKLGGVAHDFANLLAEKMIELGGVGLSANQVGFDARVFVFGNEAEWKVMFNPQIIAVSERMLRMPEQCLSYPLLTLNLRRPRTIQVMFQDADGVSHTKEYTDIAARIILHEYDHMEGANFTYHTTPYILKKELAKLKTKMEQRRRRNARYEAQQELYAKLISEGKLKPKKKRKK